MNRDALFGIGVLIAIGAVILGLSYRTPQQNSAPDSNSGSASSSQQSEVERVAREFGQRLQFVSLLASTEERTIAMNEHYSAYVAPELLAKWYPEGAEALGRYTSSPWPDRMDIVDVIPVEENFVVEANVLEVANTDEGIQPAAVYPVSLALEKRGGQWKIVKMEKGAYSQLPHRQTIVGYWECLPPKDRSGPQTLECAFGIAIDQSDGHFAVDTRLMAMQPVDFPTGTKVRVSGIVTPANQLSSPQKYDIDGIISATTIERVQ